MNLTLYDKYIKSQPCVVFNNINKSLKKQKR